ncbi:translin associated factor X [Bombus vancouverensis nearcticus]|uniref:Translin-associated protein X n=1 Tax=Bombus bifarius TaxID=103933 RepID=A0A6P8M8B5_9HYME|nr:translin-associated protein X [Bombus vancouverensis nearcticus]XP_033298840.1 translin-associated protein X [Bombus bifarius]
MSQIKDEEGGENHGHCCTKKINIDDKRKEIVDITDQSSEILQQFRAYATELDNKHDRFERIVKFGRDITIESKRIIFLLHTIDKKGKQESVLREADMRLQKVARSLFKSIAHELEGQDPYLYLKAYRNGLEEYVEAVTFYQYLKCDNMKSWLEIEKTLTYKIPEISNVKTIQVLVSPYEYILGIADLTGELMRMCINNLATGDRASCYQTCNFVRDMYTCFLGCTNASNRLVNRKLYTLEQNLHKIENVCYTVKIRGSEIPKHILVDLVNEEYADSDESYHAY